LTFISISIILLSNSPTSWNPNQTGDILAMVYGRFPSKNRSTPKRHRPSQHCSLYK